MKGIRVLGLCAVILLAACSRDIDSAEIQTDKPYMSAADRIVTINGDRVRYRAEGPEGAPTLILLHGFTDSLHGWDRQIGRAHV